MPVSTIAETLRMMGVQTPAITEGAEPKPVKRIQSKHLLRVSPDRLSETETGSVQDQVGSVLVAEIPKVRRGVEPKGISCEVAELGQAIAPLSGSLTVSPATFSTLPRI